MVPPAKPAGVPDDASEGGGTDAAGGGSAGGAAGEQPAAGSAEAKALRRQQLFAGTAIASLSGMAVVVAGLQQFPGLTPIVPFGAGMVTTAATFAVVYASIFGT